MAIPVIMISATLPYHEIRQRDIIGMKKPFDIISSIPALPLHIFRVFLVLGAVFSLYYTWQSTSALIKHQPTASEQQSGTTVAASVSPTRQLAL